MLLSEVDVSLGETLSGETTAIRVYNSQFINIILLYICS